MDPNLAQPVPALPPPISTPPPIPRKFPQKNILLIAVLILILLALLLLGLNYPKLFKTPPKPQPIVQTIKPSPTPTLQTSIKISTNRGIITAISDQSISIKSGTNTQTFSLELTKDIQKIVSGTLESGKVKTAPVKLSDLKVGKEVLVVSEKDSTIARSILIVK